MRVRVRLLCPPARRPPRTCDFGMEIVRSGAIFLKEYSFREDGEFYPEQLYPAAIRYGYGEIWSRPGLEPRERALVAIAAFTALRLPEQAAKFGQSALNVGLIDVGFADENRRTDQFIPEVRNTRDMGNDHLPDAAVLGVFLHDNQPVSLVH